MELSGILTVQAICVFSCKQTGVNGVEVQSNEALLQVQHVL